MNTPYSKPVSSGSSPQNIPVFILFLIVLLISLPGSALYAQTDSLKIEAVPLREIANEAAGDRQQMRDMLAEQVQLTTSYELLPKIDSLETSVTLLDDLTTQTLDSRLDRAYYSSLALKWDRENSLSVNLQESLQKYLAKMEELGTDLDQKLSKWQLTQETTDPTMLTEDIVARIDGINHHIDSTRQILNDSVNSSLVLLNRLADIDLVIETSLHDVNELMKAELGSSILSREVSIFTIKNTPDTLDIKGDRTFLLTMGIRDSKVYLQNERHTLLLLGIAFVCLLIAMLLLKKGHTALEPGANQDEIIKEKILHFPLATAFVFTMLLALWWLPARPILMKEIFVILFILPFLPIVRSLAFKGIHLSLYYLFAILLYNILNDYLQLGMIYLRISSLLESLALFSFHIYFLLAKRRLPRNEIKGHFFYQLLNTIQPFYFLLTFLAVLANIFGYWNYAEVVNEGVLMSLILLLLFPTGFYCLLTAIHYFFQTQVAEKSLVLKDSKDQIYKWLFRNLRFGTALLWVIYSMRLFYLWDPFLAGANKVLDIGHQFGELAVSIRDILGFILIVYLSWLVSFLIRNLLEIELFGRFKLPRGVPRAVSSLTQYFLITVGFLLALSSAGFTMQNLGLLAGALGVGIGFGLQNIVNNFISGLILAFERPVTVGDLIIVGGLEGEVKRIGIRASVIKQYDGSEIIVPNADLISKQVINWTLTKYTRRIIMTIHTHQDTDTDQVLKVMKEAAGEVEFVLKKPEAKAYFHGIKDNQFEFALFYWASGNILDCKSEVNQQVQKALRDAGITFVMPTHVVMEKEQKPE